MVNYFDWVPQEAHPEIRTQGQVVYLGDGPRKQQHGERESATQKGRQPIKGMWQASDCYRQVELSIPRGHWDTADNRPHIISVEGEEAGRFLYQHPSITGWGCF